VRSIRLEVKEDDGLSSGADEIMRKQVSKSKKKRNKGNATENLAAFRSSEIVPFSGMSPFSILCCYVLCDGPDCIHVTVGLGRLLTICRSLALVM
jgi:hypothetical protein